MPWKISDGEQKRREFIAAICARKGAFAVVCRAYDISRECGHKWWRRFKAGGLAGLKERSRRPSAAMRLQGRWRKRCERLRRRFPRWGALPLRVLLRASYPREHLPAVATITRWLAQAKLVQPRLRRARPGPLLPRPHWRRARQPNDVWTVDFKGRFHTGDGSRLQPLTVRDQASRYILAIVQLEPLSDRTVRPVLLRLFRRFGLPRAIHVDNGGPFGGNGALGLSTLSVWWLRLGIEVEFSRPARPGDNAAHEHMHGILKRETARPAAATRAAQLRRFERFRRRYNQVRPHRSLRLRPPASRYRHSPRRWPRALPRWHYPRAWALLCPGQGGRVWWAGRQRVIGRAFAHELLGLAPLPHGAVRVYLGPHLLGTLHPHDLAGIRPVRRPSPLPLKARSLRSA
jgi:transposase InsO family protein